MKKTVAIVLCAAMLLSLCACSAVDKLQQVELPPLPEVSESPTPTAESAAPTAQPEPEPEEPVTPLVDEGQENRVVVNFETTSYERFDPPSGLQRILTFSYVTPKIRIEGRTEAADKINEYIAMLDETYYTGNDYGDGPAWGFNGILEAAEDNYAYAVTMGDRSLPLEYSASRSAKVGRIDNKLIDIVLEAYEYTGGEHGHYRDRAYVFDCETGERLRLEDIGAEGADLRAALVQAMLDAVEANPDYYAEHLSEELVRPEEYEQVFAALLREGSWYFGEQGLVIFSDLEVLAPYEAGLTEFVIPYDALQGQLAEKWMPGERAGAGQFRVIPLSQVEEGSLALLDKITVSEGEELCLLAEGTVYDVYLSTVYYTDSFHEKVQHWCSSYMSDSALQIVSAVPEGIPDLMIRYTTADGQRVGKLLSQSGLDGSYMLVDEQIEVLG